VEAEGKVNSLDVARILAKVNESENADILLLGKQAIDSDNNQTGQMLAALLDVPQATFASEVKIADGKAQVTREVDGGLVTVEMDLQSVVTTDLRLNEPRFAALPKIMQAKRKPLEVKTVADLGVELTNSIELLSVETPAERSGGIKVDSVDALIDKLRNEAQVI
jgi:electron transfer flavoprotein beta subunit